MYSSVAAEKSCVKPFSIPEQLQIGKRCVIFVFGNAPVGRAAWFSPFPLARTDS